MGNLGLYQLMTSVAKRVGGPLIFLGLLLTLGAALGFGVYAGGAAINNSIRDNQKKKEEEEATAVVYTVEREGTSNEGLSFKEGEQFKVLEKDGDAGLITKLGDPNNPYFVSLKFLNTISNYQLS